MTNLAVGTAYTFELRTVDGAENVLASTDPGLDRYARCDATGAGDRPRRQLLRVDASLLRWTARNDDGISSGPPAQYDLRFRRARRRRGRR